MHSKRTRACSCMRGVVRPTVQGRRRPPAALAAERGAYRHRPPKQAGSPEPAGRLTLASTRRAHRAGPWKRPQGRERTNPELAGSSYTAREYNSKRGYSIKAGPHACGLQPPSGASAPARARRSKQQQGQPTRSNSKQAGRGKQQKQQPSRQQTQGSRNSRQRARAGSCPPGRASPARALL